MAQAGRAPERVAVGSREPHETRIADVETASEGYARRFAGPVGRWMLERQATLALGLIARAGTGPLSLLEVGGGHGQLTGSLRAAGHRVVVHGSRPVCHARLRRPGDGIPRVASDLWRLPFGAGAFDGVIAIRLLAHVEDWRALLAELARVAGRFVLVDFPVRGAVHRLAPALFGVKRRVEGNTRPYFDYRPAEVEAVFTGLGMRVAGVARQFALPMALHRALKRPGVSRSLEGMAERAGSTRRIGSPILMLAETPRTESRGEGR